MARTKLGEAEAKWRKHVEAWEASGLSLRAFAERESVNRNTLWSWKRKLRGVTRAFKAKAPTFAPVIVHDAAPRAQTSVFELATSGGLTLKIPADFDESALARIVRALEVLR